MTVPFKSLLPAAALALVCFSACKKDKDSAPDFMPMTAGSSWTYQSSTAGTYTLTVTGKDTVALGRSYKVISNSAGPNNYWAKSANEYYRFGVIQGIGTNGFEELYLKDNQDVNASWTSNQPINITGIPIALTATLKYTIKEKDITRTISGKTYNKVIHVGLDVSVNLVGPLGGGNYYYADKVGLIEGSLVLTAQGTPLINQTDVLTSYTIK